MGERCSVDTARDIDTVTSRVKKEGLGFYTISLPAFLKAFERWLEIGPTDPTLCPGFRFRGRLPVFLRGFMDQIFHTDGAVREIANVDAILAVRQLCGVYGKLFLQASASRTDRAMLQFLETDEEVEAKICEWTPNGDLAFSRVSQLLFNRIFAGVNADIAYGRLTPKHGPGQTAEYALGNDKFLKVSWHWRLEKYFSSSDYLIPSYRYHSYLESVRFLDPQDESPVRVISVPKTQKTPRIIAIEPICMQYTQQAVASGLTKGIRNDYIVKRFLRLQDQVFNQDLARVGSLQGTLATLDLSEASDRVPNALVRTLFKHWQHLDGAVQACRSTRANVQLGDGVVTRHLSKFASMGSALTFPVEAMVFLTVVFMGIERALGRRLRLADVIRLDGQVAVYGDDIIVPVDYVGSVVHELESFGFKVNSQKSFWNGKFRESCGKDYYAGFDVSYVKLRQKYPDNRQNAEEVVSLVSFFNQCKDQHYDHTTAYLRKEISKLLGGFFPRVSRKSELLGEWDDVNHDIIALCSKTHRPLSKGWKIKTHTPVNPLDGEQALLKFFLKQGNDPLSEGHLHRSGRSSAVSITLGRAAT
jgi:hypothetical protein